MSTDVEIWQAFSSLAGRKLRRRLLLSEADRDGDDLKENRTMQVDVELRERLAEFCMVTKQRQEKAANVAIREMLERCEADPVMKERMDRARSLKEAMAAL